MLQEEFSLHHQVRWVSAILFRRAVSSRTPGLQSLQLIITGYQYNVLPNSLRQVFMVVATHKCIHQHSNHIHLVANLLPTLITSHHLKIMDVVYLQTHAEILIL